MRASSLGHFATSSSNAPQVALEVAPSTSTAPCPLYALNAAERRTLVKLIPFMRVSAYSMFSPYSIMSFCSILSTMSAGTILGFLAAGSIASGLSLGSIFSFFSIGSFMSIGCVGGFMEICW